MQPSTVWVLMQIGERRLQQLLEARVAGVLIIMAQTRAPLCPRIPHRQTRPDASGRSPPWPPGS